MKPRIALVPPVAVLDRIRRAAWWAGFVGGRVGGRRRRRGGGACRAGGGVVKPADAVRLRVAPCRIRTAKDVVGRLHRHHRPPVGGLFAVAVEDDSGVVRGAAVVGRPVARRLDDGLTVEVTRVATDGTPNACSMLYAAAWRAARALGYRRCVTYTLPSEGGASLRGAGWRVVGETKDEGWSRGSRPRGAEAQVPGAKLRWMVSE